jgi:hypothetical protein
MPNSSTVGQKELDIWALRGFGGVLKILDRSKINGGFSPEAKHILSGYKEKLLALISRIEDSYIEIIPAQTQDIDAIDHWFTEGTHTLLDFLIRRLESGPPIKDGYFNNMIQIHQRLGVILASAETHTGGA